MIESASEQFPVLLNVRTPNHGHFNLHARRNCLLPSAPRVRLRTLNRTSYESRNAMTNVPASDDGGWLRYPKKKRGRLQCGVCPEKRMAKQERGWTRKVSASLMAITSHLPKGWVSERYSCSDSSACLRLRMRCATPMHSTAPPAIQVKVTPLRPVRGRPVPFWSTMVKLSLPTSAFAESA